MNSNDQHILHLSIVINVPSILLSTARPWRKAMQQIQIKTLIILIFLIQENEESRFSYLFLAIIKKMFPWGNCKYAKELILFFRKRVVTVFNDFYEQWVCAYWVKYFILKVRIETDRVTWFNKNSIFPRYSLLLDERLQTLNSNTQLYLLRRINSI